MKKITILLLASAIMVLMQACEKPVKNADLPVRKACNLERLYKDMPQDIRMDTPDMAFVNALCAGKADEVAGLFREKKLFWDEPPAIDAPYGRFEGPRLTYTSPARRGTRMQTSHSAPQSSGR